MISDFTDSVYPLASDISDSPEAEFSGSGMDRGVMLPPIVLEAVAKDTEYQACSWQDSFAMTVQVFDTDCFNVVWHGAYTKWLEMGRVRLLERYGIGLSLPTDPTGYVYPVAEQQLRFKSPARYGEKLVLMTGLRIEGYKLYFIQRFWNVSTDKKVLEAETLNLIVDMQWRLQRRLPEGVAQKLGLPKSGST